MVLTTQDDVFLLRLPGVAIHETQDPAVLSVATDAVYAAIHA